ncbi:uncharacterized protein LOC131928572 [Physella acuta]|uniref:uncharacterized protein LOC131928572 n=1 Tax=Physella acuta TaxID=109671 RepID=UPI0027DD2F22|nr:uncharacterized protein LOC131928572 [Physella acuta]
MALWFLMTCVIAIATSYGESLINRDVFPDGDPFGKGPIIDRRLREPTIDSISNILLSLLIDASKGKGIAAEEFRNRTVYLKNQALQMLSKQGLTGNLNFKLKIYFTKEFYKKHTN